MSAKSFGERIADILIEDGLLLPSQLEEAQELQKKQGGRLLKLLTDNQLVTEQDMVISMGRCLDKPPINLAKVRDPRDGHEPCPQGHGEVLTSWCPSPSWPTSYSWRWPIR